MISRLKSRDGVFPPEGYPFTDPKTGMKFTDGDFNDVVRRIIAHRRANPRIYPPKDLQFLNFELVAAELDSFTCGRLKNNPRFCESGEPITLEPKPGAAIVQMVRPCYKCGYLLGYELLCATCAGRKLQGYICASCKAPLGN